jgi:xylulokinase
VLLPYFAGERTPIQDPGARGAVLGLTLQHTRAHLFRAVLEGVAFGVRHNVETVRAAGATIERVHAVGGGAATDVWLQIVSDATGLAQQVSAVNVGASYGDAFLAGLAIGAHGWDDLSAWVKRDRTIEPNDANAAVYDARYGVYRELYEATKGLNPRLR